MIIVLTPKQNFPQSWLPVSLRSGVSKSFNFALKDYLLFWPLPEHKENRQEATVSEKEEISHKITFVCFPKRRWKFFLTLKSNLNKRKSPSGCKEKKNFLAQETKRDLCLSYSGGDGMVAELKFGMSLDICHIFAIPVPEGHDGMQCPFLFSFFLYFRQLENFRSLALHFVFPFFRFSFLAPKVGHINGFFLEAYFCCETSASSMNVNKNDLL